MRRKIERAASVKSKHAEMAFIRQINECSYYWRERVRERERERERKIEYRGVIYWPSRTSAPCFFRGRRLIRGKPRRSIK